MNYLVGTNGDWSTIYACREEWTPEGGLWEAISLDGEFKALDAAAGEYATAHRVEVFDLQVACEIAC